MVWGTVGTRMRLRKSTAAVLALLAESGLALTPYNIAKNTDVVPGIARKRCESLLNAEYVESEESWDRTFYRITKLGRGRLLMRHRETAWVEGLGPDAQVRLFVDAVDTINEAQEPPTVPEIATATDTDTEHVADMLAELQTAGLVEADDTGDEVTYSPTMKAQRLILSYD